MTVIVRGNVMKHHSGRIAMSMSRLQEKEVRQEFHSDNSSTLFLRHPERLWRRYDEKGKTFMFAARGQGIEEPMTVLASINILRH